MAFVGWVSVERPDFSDPTLTYANPDWAPRFWNQRTWELEGLGIQSMIFTEGTPGPRPLGTFTV